MKKILIFILTIVLLLSCAACQSIPEAHPDSQQEAIEHYIAEFLPGGEIVQSYSYRAGLTKLYDVKDPLGFNYALSISEIPLSDLGFEKTDSVVGEDYATIVESNYTSSYIYHLVSTTLDQEALMKLSEKYQESFFSIRCRQGTAALLNGAAVNDIQTGIFCEYIDEAAIAEFAAFAKESDTNNLLNDYTMPIYALTVAESGEATSSNEPIAYYDFYFDRIVYPAEMPDFSMLRDYLYALHVETPRIVSVQGNVPTTSVSNKDFQFIDSNEVGSLITFTTEDGTFEYYSVLGVEMDASDHYDDFGVMEGSFLDVISTERSGLRPFYISYYALAYPDLYGNLAVYCFEKEAPEEPSVDEEVTK